MGSTRKTVLVAAGVAVALALLALTGLARPGADDQPVAASGADIPGRMLVRGVLPGRPQADGPVRVVPGGARMAGLARLRCRRLHASPAGPVLCLRVSSNGFDYEAVMLDGAGRTVARRPVAGFPSRVRVSPDGRYGAYTAFGDFDEGYFSGTEFFSTDTRILDMRTGAVLLRLEDLDVRRDGAPVADLAYAELWGVTFGAGGRFYATAGLPRERGHLLIAGRVGSRRARVVGDHVECPSLSPDGTRIAYKRRIGKSDRWRLHVRRLDGGGDVALAERRSIDDQPEWIGDDRVAYSDGRAVFAVPADGSGAPERLAGRATSPAWLPQVGGAR